MSIPELPWLIEKKAASLTSITTETKLLLSIAISAKRIADLMDGDNSVFHRPTEYGPVTIR